MTEVQLATALLRRGDRILLVASRYPNHEHPLWNMPGGRRKHGELLEQTVLRELAEETGLQGRIAGLAYVSESYDRDTHFLNVTFDVDAQGEPRASSDPRDHVVACEWIDVKDLEQRLSVRVVREPLAAHLRDERERYFSYAVAGISIVFPD